MKRAVTRSARKPATRAKKSRRPIDFFHKPTCPTCRKARRFIEKRGGLIHFHDLSKERLSVAELEKLIGKRDHEEFLNPRSDLYRKEGMKEDPPSRREAIRMMAREPNLMRRPVIVAGGRVVIGYDKNGMVKLF